jgi:hypothetical protein
MTECIWPQILNYLQQVQSLNVYIRLINAHHHVITLASFFAQRSELRTVKFATLTVVVIVN